MTASRKLLTNLIIHSFAIAHALTVILLRGSRIGDDTVLTILTILMILLLTRQYEFPLDISAAIALLCCLSGFYLGTKGAEMLEQSSNRLIAEYSNVITTVMVTEILGWITFFIVRRKRENNIAEF